VVGSLVDRLQVALVLELLARRCDVRMPALGHLPARQLHVALVKRRLDLQEEHLLLYVKDHARHKHNTLPSRPRGRKLSMSRSDVRRLGGVGPATWRANLISCAECPLSTSSRCTACRSCTRPTRRCSTTSHSPSTRARR